MANENPNPAGGEGQPTGGATDPNAQGGAPAPQGGEAAESVLGETAAPTQQGTEGGEPKGQETTQADEYKDLKFPDYAGEVDAGFLKDFKGWAKETGVKPEALQKLVDRWSQTVKEQNDRATAEAAAQAKEQGKTWLNELKADKEFGGAKFKDNAVAAKKALERFDPNGDFKKVIFEHGLDNWPPLVKFLSKIGVAAKDDSIAGTLEGATPTAATDDKKFHQELYPTMVQKG